MWISFNIFVPNQYNSWFEIDFIELFKYFNLGKDFYRLNNTEIESTLSIYNISKAGAKCSILAANLPANLSTDMMDLYGFTTPGCNYAPNAFFLSIVLFVGTFLIATNLKQFKEFVWSLYKYI